MSAHCVNAQASLCKCRHRRLRDKCAVSPDCSQLSYASNLMSRSKSIILFKIAGLSLSRKERRAHFKGVRALRGYFGPL